MLDILVRAFVHAAQPGTDAGQCARATLEAIDRVPEHQLTPRPAPPADGTPVTSVTPMLTAATETQHGSAEPGGPPHEPVNTALLQSLRTVERRAGASVAAARDAALSMLAERDEALAAQPQIEPPPISPETFCAHVAELLRQIGSVCPAAVRRAA